MYIVHTFLKLESNLELINYERGSLTLTSSLTSSLMVSTLIISPQSTKLLLLDNVSISLLLFSLDVQKFDCDMINLLLD